MPALRPISSASIPYISSTRERTTTSCAAWSTACATPRKSRSPRFFWVLKTRSTGSTLQPPRIPSRAEAIDVAQEVPQTRQEVRRSDRLLLRSRPFGSPSSQPPTQRKRLAAHDDRRGRRRRLEFGGRAPAQQEPAARPVDLPLEALRKINA